MHYGGKYFLPEWMCALPLGYQLKCKQRNVIEK